MRREYVRINSDLIKYDISKIHDPDRVLFLDIETTGLSSRNSIIYMIGMIHREATDWCFESLLADSPAGERELLKEFNAILHGYDHLIHFNGNTFDIPFISDRCKANGIESRICEMDGLDIYRSISPYKKLLGLDNCRQKTIEHYLGIGREDKYSGGELINVYHEYTQTHDEGLYRLLYTHNHEDLTGMLGILPVLGYYDLFNHDIDIDNVRLNEYMDVLGVKKYELLADLKLKSALPRPLSISCDGCYLSAKDTAGSLKIPVYDGELKYFYDNPREYYYLPEEDMAVHKSLSMYVDKDHRRPAKAANCYTRKTSLYLPQREALFTPVFKADFGLKSLYFELSEGLLSDHDSMLKYIRHILSYFISQSRRTENIA